MPFARRGPRTAIYNRLPPPSPRNSPVSWMISSASNGCNSRHMRSVALGIHTLLRSVDHRLAVVVIHIVALTLVVDRIDRALRHHDIELPTRRIAAHTLVVGLDLLIGLQLLLLRPTALSSRRRRLFAAGRCRRLRARLCPSTTGGFHRYRRTTIAAWARIALEARRAICLLAPIDLGTRQQGSGKQHCKQDSFHIQYLQRMV